VTRLLEESGDLEGRKECVCGWRKVFWSKNVEKSQHLNEKDVEISGGADGSPRTAAGRRKEV